MDNLVYFAHGKESGPQGTKIQHLSKVAKNMGFEFESPDYSFTQDEQERIDMLLALAPQADNLVLVGSSMGAYVSTVASEVLKPKGLFLMAPAFFVPEYAKQSPKPHAVSTMIVHGRDDTIVPMSHSQKYAEEHNVELRIFDSDHRLTSVLTDIEELFQGFLRQFV